jgi:putative transposase
MQAQVEAAGGKARRGGARAGAGRKARPQHLRRTPHRARPVHRKTEPVHVTMRSVLRTLRSRHVVRTVLGAIRDSQRGTFRIAQYSIQANHLHLIVEADDKPTLSAGVKGLVMRLVKRMNRLLSRSGPFAADRWYGRALTSDRQVRTALVYVINNHRKHIRRPPLKGLDPMSSAQWFDGFAFELPSGFRSIGPPSIAPATTRLLRTAWRRRGRIQWQDSPAPRREHGEGRS